jgi:DNA-binding transcriptional ArsR family regulator
MKQMSFHWEKAGLRMVDVLKAFADINRMKIIRILSANPDESVKVTDLANMLGITQPAVSQNIKILKSVGVLIPKRVKNMTYYSIDIEQLKGYKEEIDEMFTKALTRCTFEGSCDECPKKSCYD